MAKDKIKKVYLLEEEIEKNFFWFKTEDGDITGFSLFENLITHDVVIMYNDIVKDARKFRGVDVQNVTVFSEEKTGIGLVLSDVNIIIEDIFGETETIKATTLFSIYKIGNIIMAELYEDMIHFGNFLSKEIKKDWNHAS